MTDFGLAITETEAEGGSTEPLSDLDENVPHERFTRSGSIVGTPLYMAPEQHLGKEITVAADQYAFCVSLWEALHGKPPLD